MTRRPLALASGITLLLLAGCATEPAESPATPAASPTTPSASATVDLTAAAAWFDEVSASVSDGPGAAVSAGMLVTNHGTPTFIVATIDNPTKLVRADVRCFGGGTAQVAVTAVSADGGESEPVTSEVVCDEAPHGIELDLEATASVRLEALGSMETYLHATFIEELVVEY